MKIGINIFSFWILLAQLTQAQSQAAFSKGINLTGWFQASGARQIQFSKFTKKDFEDIKSLGCDVIRLPINLHSMTNGQPDYLLDPLFLEFLDRAVSWAEELKISIILDNHTFDPVAATDPLIGTTLVKVWSQMANHYKNRSPYVYYEVLNEPHGIADNAWGQIQQTVIDAIRLHDTTHFIVVGGSGYNGYNNLNSLPFYTDSKLIYTFHFYDPFIFTHQGASWVEPSLVPLSNVPFPFAIGTTPSTPVSLKGTWLEDALNNYSSDGTVLKVKQQLEIALAFKNLRNVPVFCGEFGVYIPNSNNDHRSLWYKEVRSHLEKIGIPWTTWDYKGGFGLFEKNSNELFDYDLNIPLLEALGFNVKPQKEFSQEPINKGFSLYDDYIQQGIEDASYLTKGVLDFYNVSNPNSGKYSILWAGVDQYSSIALDFKPDLDFSQAIQNNFEVEFWVRGATAGSKFNVRFIDTKTKFVGDHPWRMDKLVDESMLAWDNKWHKVRVPLTGFSEGGSYDDGLYLSPQGKFDWGKVDRFEFVAEHGRVEGMEFDNIVINGEEFEVTGLEKETMTDDFLISPNPLNQTSSIHYQVLSDGKIHLAILSMEGVILKEFFSDWQIVGKYSLNLNDISFLESLDCGLYLIKATLPQGVRMQKVVFVK